MQSLRIAFRVGVVGLGIGLTGAHAAEPCRNTPEIHRAASELTVSLTSMLQAAKQNYRWAPNLRQSIQQAEVASGWIQRVTESGWVPCEFTLSSADNLTVRMRGLRNQFKTFAFFRNEKGVEQEWQSVQSRYADLVEVLDLGLNPQ